MKAFAIVTLLALSVAGVAVAAPPQTIDPSVVFAGMQLLRTNHIDRPDPIRLLTAALDGLRQALSRIGVSERLADLDSSSEASARASFAARFNQALGLTSGRLSSAQLEYAATNAMASNLGDPFNTFFTPEELAEFRAAGFGGVGIRFRRIDNSIYAWHVSSGGPAAQAGLREYDQIVAVDGQSLQGLSNDEVRNRIRGPQGSTVRLTIRRPGQTSPLTLTATRRLITPALIRHRMLQGSIGYIQLYVFDQGTSVEVRAAVEDLSRQGIRALILDLRLSTGGPYRELDEISNFFLPSGLLIYSVTGQESRTHRTAGTPLIGPTVRIVVLIDSDTEALSELLAAAISEHGRGRLVGTKTPGRGGLYRTFDLPGGGAIRIKTGRASTGKGVPLENGVRPEIEVRLTSDNLDGGQDPQLERAIQMVSQP